MEVLVTADAFDPGAELSAFSAEGGGAVVTFTGVVRGGAVKQLEIEHYPGMTEAAIAAMTGEARARFGLSAVRVIHRHGHLAAGEPIMMVLTAAAHRRAAFEAADFLMDWLKSRAPFWKREHGVGGAAWVEARDEDEAALRRWEGLLTSAPCGVSPRPEPASGPAPLPEYPPGLAPGPSPP